MAVQTPSVNPESPWLGPSSFTEHTAEYFFGRESEITELLDRIRNATLTILYGRSGRGKSSLLAAGIIPELRKKNYAPIILRLQESTSYVSQLRGAWNIAIGAMGEDQSLWERGYSKQTREEIAEKKTPIPILILDQFEEVFTQGHSQTEELQALFSELACLVENRVPNELCERFATDEAFASNFVEQLTPARVVITLREDFLAQLEGWKGELPSLMRNRMALLPLKGVQAQEAVIKPANIRPEPLMEEETADAIVRIVAQQNEDKPLGDIEAVDPFLLSLMCFELNNERLKSGAGKVSLPPLETSKSDILQSFYEECFLGLHPIVQQTVEKRLVGMSEGREQLSLNTLIEILKNANLTPDKAKSEINQLIRRRLLTIQRGVDGVERIELTHILFAPLVVRSRSKREAQEEIEAKRKEEEDKRNQAENRGRWLLRFLVGSVALICICVYYWYRANEALKQANKILDDELSIMEDPITDEILGFDRIESKLLDLMLPTLEELQKKNNDKSSASILRKVKLKLRQAERLQRSGRPKISLQMYIDAFNMADLQPQDLTPELRSCQFQSLYRIDRLLADKNDKERDKWIEKGFKIFNSNESSNGSWKDSYAQTIAKYWVRHNTPQEALAVLDLTLDNFQKKYPLPTTFELIETKSVLTDTKADVLSKLDKKEDAKKFEQVRLNLMSVYRKDHPRSIKAATHTLDMDFNDLHKAYWNRDEIAFKNLYNKIDKVTQDFHQARDNRFEDAKAKLETIQAEYALWVAHNPREAKELASKASADYREAYKELIDLNNAAAVEPFYFNIANESVITLIKAMEQLEAQSQNNQQDAKKNGEELLETIEFFNGCANDQESGADSSCASIVATATSGAVDRLQDNPQKLTKVLAPLLPIIHNAAKAMVEKDDNSTEPPRSTDRPSTEPLFLYCKAANAYANALLKIDPTKALSVLNNAKKDCEKWIGEYAFNTSLHLQFAELLRNLAAAQKAVGEANVARKTLDDCAKREFFTCYEPLAEMLDAGQGGEKDELGASEWRSRKPNIKEFTIQVQDKKYAGAPLTIPAKIYIQERSETRQDKGIDDQAHWLERDWNLNFPNELLDKLKKLEDDANKSNGALSFIALASNALEETQKQQDLGKSAPTSDHLIKK